MDEGSANTVGSGGAAGGAPPQAPRGVNVVFVAGAVILIGLVSFAIYRRTHLVESPPAPEAAASPTPGGTPGETLPGSPITATVPVRLTPEASIVAERYRCVCSCNDPLNVCTCSKTPGSRDMKQYVQQLVDQKKSVREIDAAMMSRYGSAVLIATPAKAPVPAKKPRR